MEWSYKKCKNSVGILTSSYLQWYPEKKMKISGICWMKPEHLPWLTCNWARMCKKGQREESFHKIEVSVLKNNSDSGENTAFDWKSNKKKNSQNILPFCCDFFPHRNQVLLSWGLHIDYKKDSVGSR